MTVQGANKKKKLILQSKIRHSMISEAQKHFRRNGKNKSARK